jgi:beta-galactosidase
MKMSMFQMVSRILLLAVFCMGCTGYDGPEDGVRQRIKLDLDWKFSRGDFPEAFEMDFDDSRWQQIDIPHDWAILDTFSQDFPTGRPGGFASGGVGWYRKAFTLSRKDASSKISVEFGGVYENSEVWINGHYLGKRPFGYISFYYDLTPYLDFRGDNVLAVRVDNSKQPSARWYTGCGIYRHVWLVKTGKLHVSRYGVFATTPFISEDSAVVSIRTTIENDFDEEKPFNLVNELYSPDKKLVGRIETSAVLPGKATLEIDQDLTVPEPTLWSPDHPTLYQLKTSIVSQQNTHDEIETNIGIRYFTFSADSGFALNGESMKFLGVNNHSDLGALGAALNERVLHRRLEILKEMGCNAIRTESAL